MAATTTIYKAVKLKQNEQFTLPPGAELVAADRVEDLDSTCTLPELEDMACYELVISGAETDGSPSEPYDIAGGFFLEGLYVAGGLHVMSVSVNTHGIFDLSMVVPIIQDKFPMLQDIIFTFGRDSGGDRGGTSSLCFKTIPSVAADTFLVAATSYPAGGGSTSFRVYAQPRGTYDGTAGACPDCDLS